MPLQLPLDFRLRDEATFERFVAGSNAELIDALQSMVTAATPNAIYLHSGGEAGLGKTHLLQAMSRALDDAIYLPLGLMDNLPAEVFENIAVRRLVCIDDVDRIAGSQMHEIALFSLFKQIKDSGHALLLSCTQPVGRAGFKLQDLISRLNGCVQYQLQAVSDADRKTFLGDDAARRGLELTDDVIDWILTHTPRDMSSLTDLLNTLDKESLRAQRRITIPFIKGLL